jgi:hypothetical protein
MDIQHCVLGWEAGWYNLPVPLLIFCINITMAVQAPICLSQPRDAIWILNIDIG